MHASEFASTTIVASSGYAAEIAGIVQALGGSVVRIVGTDGAADAAAALGVDFVPFEVVTSLPLDADLAIGLGAERRPVIADLQRRGHALPPLVHPDATIGPAVWFGPGCIVSPGARITANVRIGAGVLVHTGAILSHDDVIGDFVTISPSATLCGGVTVHDDAWIAAGATILPGSTIGARAIVGAGALVNGDVAAGTTVVGVPARPRR